MVKPIWRLTEDNRGNFVRHEKRPPRSIFNRTFTIHLCVHAHLLAGWWLPYNRSIRGRNCIADTPAELYPTSRPKAQSIMALFQIKVMVWLFQFWPVSLFTLSLDLMTIQPSKFAELFENHRSGQIEVRLHVDIEFNRSNHWILLDDIGILKWIKELILNIGIKSGM